MRYTKAKARQCRREGVNLFGTEKYNKILAKKSSIPGANPSKRMPKMTEYGQQLRSKQRAKRIFCLSEKQFYKYFVKATKSKKITGDALLENLERRLDNVLYRSGFALTRMQARQFVSHGLFLFNGRRVDIPSIEVRVGDIIEARPKTKKSPVFKEIFEDHKAASVAKWLKADPKNIKIEIVSLPSSDDYEKLVDTQKIVELYSR